MVLKQDGSVCATGSNKYGQLGRAWMTDTTNYKIVISYGVKAIAAGAWHSMLLKQDGSVWAAGRNKYGKLGLFISYNNYLQTLFLVQVLA